MICNLYSVVSFYAISSPRRRPQKVKNIIQWKRGSSLNNLDRISMMRNDLDSLKENERQLDQLIETLKDSSKKQSESKQAFVTSQDLHDIDMYTDQMIMVVKAPPESQLILMDGDPPPIVLKSEKEEIDIFFCPDPSAGGGMQPAVASNDSSSDTEEEVTPRPHRKSLTATKTSEQKRRNLGSAQRNLSKAFEEMIPRKSKSKLFAAFNATVSRESSDEGVNTEQDDEEEDITGVATQPFKSTTITTTDLMLLNDPSADEAQPSTTSSFALKKDVKLSLFSPQKNWTELAEMPNLSPNFPFSHSDDAGFFPLEPEAEYNFLLADSEGIMELFDYNI